jgi:sec-independent protein translocase protein TatA
VGPLGFQELVVIFIIALLVFGPKKLPDLGKSLGKGLREFKKATEEIKSGIDEHMRDAENTVDDATKEMKEVGRDMKAYFYGETAPPADTVSTTEKDKEKEKETVPQDQA